MKNNMEYLTDTELENLICELEQNDMVSAPPDLWERVCEVLEQETPGILKEQTIQERTKEYRRFRLRVLTTVAAAVLAIFLLPGLDSPQQQETESEYVVRSRYETKEAALNDRCLMEAMLGGVNIFADNNKFNLFRE